MDLVTGALGKLPTKLLELLKDEYRLQTGVKDRIRGLTRELERMHAALRKVAQVPPDKLDELVLLWARDVRQASYDMEDITDTFLVRVDGDPKEPPDANKVKQLAKKMSNLFSLSKGKARHEIAGAIDALSKQLEEVALLRGRYTVDDIVPKPAANTSIDPRLSSLYTKVSQLVGIDDQRDKVMQMLTEGDHDMQPNHETKIVSVVGVGGLGKTTLVKAVYDKLTIDIPYKAFVPVGQNPDLKNVLKDILIALDKDRYMMAFNFAILDERQLIDELRELLKGKRYFIVIDDVWDIGSWRIIRNGLHDNGLGSKIVITTRKHDVAKEVGCYYKMEPLPYESSKALFHTRIFGCEDRCPKDLSEISEKLLKKCGGVPLAIITTSSLLANKSRNIKVWNEVSDSIGSGLGSNDNMDNMRKILSLSYYDLPSPLKTCLLYLSIFLEDYEIEKECLIWRKIAEDFVQQGQSQSLFEIGESYFHELLNRSLIQVAGTFPDGTPDSCRVHDMVLELICSLSRQENFVTTVLGDSMQRKPPSAGSKKVRRLCLKNRAWPTMEMSKLRSIAIFSSAKFNSLMASVSCCHLLRVLDLQGCNLRDHPSLTFVGILFHLRYLSLEGTGYGGELPAEIGKLQFLQTLNLWDTEINELPSSITGLRQLIYLCGNERTRLPNGLRCLTLLEALFQVSVDSACMAEELGHLTQLRTLYVRLRKDKDGRWDENLCAAFVRSLAKLHKIKELLIDSKDMAADLDGSVESLGNLSYLRIDEATSLPTWISPASLPLLSCLDITTVQVRTDDIRVLGMLQALRVIRVKVSGEVQVLKRFTVSTDAFPCAIKCSFDGFSMAPSAFPHGAMPRLEEFEFSIGLEDFTAGKFTGDDLALAHLLSLQSAHVDLRGEEDVSEEVVMEVEEKLKHEADVHPNHPNILVN